MAINTTTRQTTAFTSGQTFAFAFKVYEEGDVKVIRITNSTGAEEVLTITTHYTVTLNDDQNADPGGSITLVNSGSPVNLGSGFSIVITSKVTPLQQTEITNQGGFFPEVINDVLDKAAILDQQQQAILDKTIRFPLTQTVGGLEITENAANRAGKVVQFDGSGDLAILATVDGRDVSADGAKLDTIETNAKDDQTAAEIRTLVESANDSNVFTDADHNKLNGIEAGATADLTASEIKALYEGNGNTNVFSDAQVSKLNGIEAGATGDQSASEIRTLVGSANDSNVFTDDDHSKLDGIETGATADQTSGDIKTLLQSDKLTHLELANDSVRVSQIQDNQITAAKLDPAAVITASEQASATPNDTSFLTSAAADARFFNVSTGDTIKDGDTFPDNDTTIATTAAINDRIIDLVDDVGGFVPIANETSFPTANPDAENGTGTVVSVKTASTDLTPSGTTVTIANGAGTGNTVTITGVPSVIPSGFGFLVETTSTLHTYTFHRLTPKATEVTTVAGKAVEIGRLGTADAVADMAILGTTDVVADMNMLATTDIVADMALLATTDVIADMALLAVTDVISDMNDLATSANITAMANCSNSISSINNASSNLNSINNFGDKYQVAANDPTTDGGGNSLAEGDLYFNTSANRLKVYDGSSWVNGVEISGSGAVTTGNTFTGDNRYNDNVKALFGTGSDLEIFHNGAESKIKNNSYALFLEGGSTANMSIYLRPTAGEDGIKVTGNGAAELYYDNSIKLNPNAAGVRFYGSLRGIDNEKLELGQSQDLKIFHNGTDSYIDNDTGRLIINTASGEVQINKSTTEYMARFLCDGAVQLYENNTQKFETGVGGEYGSFTAKNGTNGWDGMAVGGAAIIFMGNSSSAGIWNDTDNEWLLKCNRGAATELQYDGVKKLETSAAGVSVTGRVEPTGGVWIGSDLKYRLYVNGVINRFDTYAREVAFVNKGTDGSISPYMARMIPAGAVELYHNGQKRFETDQYGCKLAADNLSLKFGASDDLSLSHDGTNSIITHNTGSGLLRLNVAAGGEVRVTKSGPETIAQFIPDGAVRLYYDNALKLETTTSGIKVRGVNANVQIQPDTGSGYATVVFKNSDGTTAGSVGTYGSYIYYQNVHHLFHFGGQYRLHMTGSDMKPYGGQTLNLGASGAAFNDVYGTTFYGDGSNLTGINTDLLSDTSPQLGGDLDTNGFEISLDDNHKIKFGDNNDFHIKHDGANWIESMSTHAVHITVNNASEYAASFRANASVDLYYDGSKKLETTTHGIKLGGANTVADSSADDIQIGLGTGHAGMTIYSGTSSVGAIYFADGSGSNSYRGFYQYEHSSDRFIWGTANVTRLVLDSNGHLLPNSNNSYDLGSTSYRWRNIYTNDLNLSNEGGANDVDGTWGSYTIQEGAEDLFLINKRNGKKYKFALMEVS